MGLANYAKFFTYEPMTSAIVNSFVFTISVTILGLITQLGMALVLYRGIRGVGFFKTVFYLPLLFSWVIQSVIWGSILRFNGLLNTLLESIGLEVLIRDWLGEIGTSMAAVIFVNTWAGFGYGPDHLPCRAHVDPAGDRGGGADRRRLRLPRIQARHAAVDHVLGDHRPVSGDPHAEHSSI